MMAFSFRNAILGIVLIAACSRRVPQSGNGAERCCLREGLAVASRHRVSAIAERRFTQEQLWNAMAPALRSPNLTVREIGRSIQGRPLRAVSFGRGPTRVLLWSQMHGDESTATMALADIISWFGAQGSDPLRERMSAALTVVMVPMLNPDGAQLYQRENAAGVDVNRDARVLATPEGRALKALRDSLRPAFGFNLHDQGARTLTGRGGHQAAIALLAPAADSSDRYTGARATARLVASGIAETLMQEIPGRVGKYDETFNVRAFGDHMQRWGTSTVLIESGALPDDPQKQRLRAINVAAILSALDAIATDRWRTNDGRAYDALPLNDRSAVDLLVRGGRLVLPGAPALSVDLAINYEESVAKLRPRLREVGDLAMVTALDTVDARGLFLHPAASMLTTQDGVSWLRIGAPADLVARRGSDAEAPEVQRIP